MRLLSWVWNGARIVHESLGLKREILVLAILLMPLAFHPETRTFLAARGISDWPVVDASMPAVVIAGSYLYWRLIRHAVIFEYVARPTLVVRMLDPGQRYDTYVALGNRMLRIYHVEIENASRYRAAHDVAIQLVDYQKAGDSRRVDIRSRLKVANSEAEALDLNPGARVVFELCGIEVSSTQSLAPEARDEQTFAIVPVGSGTLRIVAEARDAPAREEELRLYVDTNGTMTIKPQSSAA
ncbi:MAG: hypothetical protein WDN31_16490 [Hyphomicrobium sp.]